jgi:putative spermidine/putrescine transport system permease protein
MNRQGFSSSEHAGAVLDASDILEEPPQAGRAGGRQREALLLVPGLVFLFFFLIIPLTLSLWYSLHPDRLVGAGRASLGLANYAYLLRHGVYVDAFVRTLRLACYVVSASLLIGYPTALVLRRLHGRVGSTLILALSFPILAGPVVIVMGWMLLLPKSGPIDHLLVTLGLVRQPLQLIGTETAVAVALVQFTLAFVVLNIFNSLTRIERPLVEAASSLGANPLRAFWHVTWPLSLPGVFSASILAFALTLGAFMAPYYLGGDTQLVATTLVAQFMLTAFSWELSSTAAILLVVVALVIMFAYSRTIVRVIERSFGLRQ